LLDTLRNAVENGDLDQITNGAAPVADYDLILGEKIVRFAENYPCAIRLEILDQGVL